MPTMDLYLSACSKPASVAATKTATSSVAEDSQQCGDVSGRRPGVLVVGASGRGEPDSSLGFNRRSQGALVRRSG